MVNLSYGPGGTNLINIVQIYNKIVKMENIIWKNEKDTMWNKKINLLIK